MERAILFFIDIKQYFGKNKSLVISGRGYLWTKLVYTKYLKNITELLSQRCITLYTYVDEMKIKIGYIDNTFLWLYTLNLFSLSYSLNTTKKFFNPCSKWIKTWIKHIANGMGLMWMLYTYSLQPALINRRYSEYEWIRVVTF